MGSGSSDLWGVAAVTCGSGGSGLWGVVAVACGEW